MLTLQMQKVDTTGGPSEYSSTQAKPVTTTVAINFEEAKETNGVMKDGQGSTFEPQSTLKNIGWPPTEKQVQNSSMLPESCRTWRSSLGTEEGMGHVLTKMRDMRRAFASDRSESRPRSVVKKTRNQLASTLLFK